MRFVCTALGRRSVGNDDTKEVWSRGCEDLAKEITLLNDMRHMLAHPERLSVASRTVVGEVKRNLKFWSRSCERNDATVPRCEADGGRRRRRVGRWEGGGEGSLSKNVSPSWLMWELWLLDLIQKQIVSMAKTGLPVACWQGQPSHVAKTFVFEQEQNSAGGGSDHFIRCELILLTALLMR